MNEEQRKVAIDALKEIAWQCGSCKASNLAFEALVKLAYLKMKNKR